MSDTNKTVLESAGKAVSETADQLAGKIRDGGKAAQRTVEVTGSTLRRGIGEAAEAARERIGDAKDAIASGAGATLASVRDVAVEKADEARETLSDVGQRLAATLRDASSGETGDAVKSRVMATVADGLAQASDALRQRSVGELSAEVKSLARRHPGAFMAMAAVAGFAAARFVRSSADRRGAHQGGSGLRS